MFLGTSLNEDEIRFEPEILRRKSPLETLSPTLTDIESTFPDRVEGISTLYLSLSIVTTGSFFSIC